MACTGTLPPELGRLQSLETLRLNEDHLNGTLPTLWGQNASFLQLTQLLLETNDLSGVLPRWGVDGGTALQNLTTLSILGNTIVGPIPNWGPEGCESTALGLLS